MFGVPRMELKTYRIMRGTPDVDLGKLGKTFVGPTEVEVIDPVEVLYYTLVAMPTAIGCEGRIQGLVTVPSLGR